MFWRTASAVPRYHSATRLRAMYGWSSFTPPARMTAIVRFTGSPLRPDRLPPDSMLARRHRTAGRRLPPAGCTKGLEEQPGVDEDAVAPDRPVEVGAGRVTRVALVAHDLPG